MNKNNLVRRVFAVGACLLTSVLLFALNKTELAKALSDANAAMIVANGNIGNNAGQYPQSAVDTYSKAIQNAQNVFKNSESQTEIDSEVVALNAATETFKNSFNAVVVNYDELVEFVMLAQSVLAEAVVGNEAGQYPLATYMELYNATYSANLVLERRSTTQSKVNYHVQQVAMLLSLFMESCITAVENVPETSILVFSKPYSIVIKNAENQQVDILDLQGKVLQTFVAESVSELFISRLGIYFVRIGSHTWSVIVRN